MSEAVEGFRALAEWRKERRARLGVNCPVCTKKLPKAHPTILLPGQRCRVCKYRDPRVEVAELPVATNVVGCECRACGHVWIAAYLPMDMREMAKAMKHVCCPKCTDTKPAMAKTEKLVELGLAIREE